MKPRNSIVYQAYMYGMRKIHLSMDGITCNCGLKLTNKGATKENDVEYVNLLFEKETFKEIASNGDKAKIIAPEQNGYCARCISIAKS